jgi:flagellar biosynthetic protein FlhB
VIRLDLQLFSGEKTEKATPKRRDDARRKGQVARSQEIGQVLVLLAALFTIKAFAGMYLNEFVRLMQVDFSQGLMITIDQQSFTPYMLQMMLLIAKLVLPVMGVSLVVGVGVSYFQVGTLFTLKPLMPDLKKLDPIAGMKRLFSLKSVVESAKSMIKILIIGFVVYSELSKDWELVSQLGNMDILTIVRVMGDLTYGIFWKSGLAMLGLALFDLWYQRFDYEKSLRMSKQEIKDEHKQVEGNPEVKGKIKEKQRAMALRRMMADVPKADVVITNPTHFAVAIQYDPEKMEAPIVLAKGLDETAQRIKKIAREANVVLVENKPLARTLYATVEIGQSIPSDLFQAVAEVLAYVYRLKGKA